MKIILLILIMIAGGVGIYFPVSDSEDNFRAALRVFFPQQGGTGTSTVPVSGQVPVGFAGGVYGPAYLTAGTNITISTSSGAITINSTGGGISTSSPFAAGYISYATSSSAITNSTIYQIAGGINIGTTTANGIFYVATSTPMFTILKNGRVGIDTTSPDTNLQVGYNDTAPSAAGMGSLGVEDRAILIGGTNIGSATKGVLYLGGQNIASGGIMGEMAFFSGGNRNVAIRGHEGSIDDGSGMFTFSTRVSSAQAMTERMRIDDAGNVGIGTTTPGYKLTISGDTNITKSLYFTIENPSATEDISLQIFNSTSTIRKIWAVNKTAGDTATFNFVFGNNRNTATSSASPVFSSYQTETSTTTATSYTSFASSTISGGDILRFITTAASSSQFTFTIYYTTTEQ